MVDNCNYDDRRLWRHGSSNIRRPYFCDIIIMLSGISFIAIVTGTISSIFTSKRIMEGRGLEKIKLNNHIIYMRLE